MKKQNLKQKFLWLALIILLTVQSNTAQEKNTHLSINPKYRYALKLIGQGAEDGALNILKEIIEKDSTFGHAYKKIVNIYVTKNDIKSAQKYFGTLLQRSSENAYALFGLALTFENENNYEEALNYYKKALNQHCQYSSVYSGLAESFSKTNQNEDGISYFQEIITLDPNKALPYLGLGYLYTLNRKWQEALASLQKAITLKPDLLQALKSIQSVYTRINKYDDAIKAANEGLVISKQKMDLEFEASFLNGLGVNYWYKSEYLKALNYYENALRIYNEIGDKAGRAKQIGNIAIVYENLGDYYKAVEYYKEALNFARSLGNKDLEGGTLGNLAIAYRSLGRYAESTECYLNAISIAREIGSKADEARHLLNLGILRQKLADYRGAREYYNTSLQIANDINYELAVEYVLGNFGDLYAELELYSKALKYYEQSLEKAIELEDKRGEGIWRLYIGYINEARNNYSQAINYYKQALQTGRQSGRKEDELNALNRLGSVHLKLNLIAEAKTYFESALSLGKTINERESIWEAHAGLADVYSNLQNEQQALHQLDFAIREIEDVRSQLLLAEESSGFFQSKVEVYAKAIALLMRLHEKRPQEGFNLKAFQYAEKAKARSLIDLLNMGQLIQNLEITNELRGKWLLTNSQLESKRQELVRAKQKVGESSPEEIKIINEKILSLENDYDTSLKELNTAHPNLDRLMNPKFLTVSEIQAKLLQDKQVLIEYFVGEDNTFVWMIKNKSFDSMVLDINRKQILNMLAEVSSLFQRRDDSTGQIAGKVATTYDRSFASWEKIEKNKLLELYQMLLKPFINSPLDKDVELIIVPDDILFYFPFEMLVTKFEQGKPRYLLEDYTISYSASVSLLNPDLKRQRAPNRDLLALGNPAFGKSKAGITKVLADMFTSIFRDDQWVPLPNSEDEVKNIAQNFKDSEILIGKRATEKSFKQNAGQFRYLHVATHYLADDRQPMFSQIVFA